MSASDLPHGWPFLSAIALLYYFTPTLIALIRRCEGWVGVLVIDLLLGWSGAGWALAALDASGADPQGTSTERSRELERRFPIRFLLLGALSLVCGIAVGSTGVALAISVAPRELTPPGVRTLAWWLGVGTHMGVTGLLCLVLTPFMATRRRGASIVAPLGTKYPTGVSETTQ